MQADDGRVVTNFIDQALRGEPLTIYGDGSQTRSFCYVDDEVRGLLALLDGPVVGPVNIGNPDEFTMLEFAELVIELTGSHSTIVYRELPSDDPKLRQPDISLARRRAGMGTDHPTPRRPGPNDRLVPVGAARGCAIRLSCIDASTSTRHPPRDTLRADTYTLKRNSVTSPSGRS